MALSKAALLRDSSVKARKSAAEELKRKKPSHFVIQASVLPFAAEIRSYPGPSIPEDPQALRELQSLA